MGSANVCAYTDGRVILALVVYDYLLTFSSERRVIWGHKRFSIPTLTFLFNRYLSLLWVVITGLNQFVHWGANNSEVCHFCQSVEWSLIVVKQG